MAVEQTVAEDSFDVDKEQTKLAVAALSAHLKEVASKKAPQLYESFETIWLMVTLQRIPRGDKRPKKIPLPHPFRSSSEVCLISKEPGKIVRAKLQEAGITCINKVISLIKLRKEYKTYELKRRLLSSYDAFLCDDRIYPLAVKALGRTFLKTTKDPLPVRLTYKDWKDHIGKTLACTLLRFASGSCSAVRVGYTGQPNEEIVANILHACKVIARKVPGGSKNIKGLHIKSSLSVSLPIYNAVPVYAKIMDDNIPKPQGESKIEAVLDSLSQAVPVAGTVQKTKPRKKTASKVGVKPKLKLKEKLKANPETKADETSKPVQPEVKPSSESAPEPVLDSATELVLDLEPEVKANPRKKTASDVAIKSRMKSKAKPQAKRDALRNGKPSVVQPESKLNSESEPKTVVESSSKVGPVSEPEKKKKTRKKASLEVGVKPKPKLKAKLEGKRESLPNEKPSVVQPEARPSAESEPKSAVESSSEVGQMSEPRTRSKLRNKTSSQVAEKPKPTLKARPEIERKSQPDKSLMPDQPDVKTGSSIGLKKNKMHEDSEISSDSKVTKSSGKKLGAGSKRATREVLAPKKAKILKKGS